MTRWSLALIVAGCLSGQDNPRGADAPSEPARDLGEDGAAEEPGGLGSGEGAGRVEPACPEGSRRVGGECHPGEGEGEGEGESEGEVEPPCPEGSSRTDGECQPHQGQEGEGEGAEGCEPRGDRELCGTGADEDCDGQIDEGFEIDEPCEAGVGACHRTGEWVCTVDGRGLFCDVEAGPPASELCGNEVDDDCDGEVDERFHLGERCEVGIGGCLAAGQWECSEDGRGIVCSARRGEGRLELCEDGQDNDCDGVTDEASWLGDACGAGLGVCRTEGSWICGPDGGSECDAQPGAPEEPEGEVSCDGRDNDCDGFTDEFPAGGGACSAGQGVCRREGEMVCDAEGQPLCSARPGAPREDVERSCNGLDDDCDGEVDEGLGLGQPCASGVGSCRVAGRVACDNVGAASCSAQALDPPEPGGETRCDGLDGDCDGEVDEGCDDDGDRRCDDSMQVVGGPDACPDSADGRGDDCDDEAADVHPDNDDPCDGVDNDCDEQVDEDGPDGARCVPPFVGALVKTQGRWGFGGELGLGGARAACRVLASHADLCSRADLVTASQAGELAGARGEDGEVVTSFWVDTPDEGRCVRDAPWTENDPDADAAGRAIFIAHESGAVISERDTLCSVPRHVACCGWP